MNIKFKQMYAKNFLSFKELTFDFERFNSQTVLITGQNDDLTGDNKRSNGSGKSSLNNVLIFAVYGETLNTLKKVQNVRNWTATPKDSVEVSLSVETNGIQYSIQRILKGAKCASELKVFSRKSNDDEWSDISLSTIAETQKLIETDIVPCGKEGFLRCVILAADQNYNFFKLNKAAKNSFFEGLFELTAYSDMYNRLHRKTLDENANLVAHSKTIDSLNENILKLKNELEESKKNQSDIEESNRLISLIENELSDFDSHNDIEQIKTDNTSKLEEFKKTELGMVREKISSFDSEHSISNVDKNGNIVFDSSKDNDVIDEKMKVFDFENKIEVDTNGKIIFNNESNPNTDKVKLEERVKNGKNVISELENKITEIKEKISSLNCENTNCERSIGNMNLTLKTHSKITDILCSDCLPKYKKSVNISDYDEKIVSFNETITKNIELISSLKQELTKNNETLLKYKEFLKKLDNELSLIKEKELEIKNSRILLQSKRDMLRTQIEKEISLKRKTLQMERNALKSELKRNYTDALTKKTSELNSLLTEIENKRNIINTRLSNEKYKLKILLDSKSKSFETPIASLTETLEKTKSEFDESNESIAHFKALENVLKPDNIRKSVVPDMLKDLNYRINGYLSKMGCNYTCKFDEDFDATFTSSTGKEAEYNSFSSGEKMRLSIACCMAFKDFMQVRLNLHPNILVIDEYIDSNIDEMAVSGIMDMIHYMVGTEKISAFIISHRSEIMQNNFDSDIFMRKKDNCTTVCVNGQPIN